MNIYLVGGAVRDALLGRPVKERDWVVVGSTKGQMLDLGYVPVGKDFPVFLHPETKEEYALARKERKVAKGYRGFECDFDASVTLEEDLVRRDLTINAMAQMTDGTIVDPYHGQEDLTQKVLRHVSPAFVEDPVRILRVGRFAARYPEFSVAEETVALMHEMVKQQEVEALVPERVWKEFEKALNEKQPARFLEVLQQCGALEVLFPRLAQQYERCCEFLKRATEMTSHAQTRFIALVVAAGEQAMLDEIVKKTKLPKQLQTMAKQVLDEKSAFLQSLNADSKFVLDLLYRLDAFRRKDRFEDWLCTMNVIASLDDSAVCYRDHSASLLKKLNTLLAHKIEAGDYRDLKGKQISDYIYQSRLKLLSTL